MNEPQQEPNEVLEPSPEYSEQPQEKPPQQQAPEWSDIQKEAMSSDYGLPEEVVRSLNEEQLNQVLASFDRSRYSQQVVPPDYQQQYYQQQQYGQQYQQPQYQQQYQQPAYQPEPFKVDLSEEVDPSLSKAITGMSEHYSQAIAQQQQLLGELISYIQQSEEQRESAEFHRAVDGLGEDFVSVFGRGVVPHGSPQDYARKVMYDTYRAVVQRNPLAQRDVVVRQLARANYANVERDAERRRISQSLTNAASQAISRPTSRRQMPDGEWNSQVQMPQSEWDDMAQEIQEIVNRA